MSQSLPRLSRLFCTFGLIAAAGFVLNPNSVNADEVSTEEWNITADKVVKYEDPSSVVAQGNVILIKKEKLPPKKKGADEDLSSWAELLEEEEDEVKEPAADEIVKESEPEYRTKVTIKADWMVYDVDLETIKAKGNIHIKTDEDELFAKEGTLNLTNETGKFADATIVREEHSLHLEGKEIQKTGFDTYRIIDGWAITCKLEDGKSPPWSFSSAKADVRQNGYAVLKHAKFKIKNIPILYSPYLVIPIKDTRQTGFLFPELSSSTNSGFGINVPFFWNISDSMDATFYPEYFQNRGFMPGMEYRYVASSTNKGMFSANFLSDDLSDPSETEYYADTGYTHDNSDRWWIRGKADHNFGDWQSRLDIDIVSDQDYLDEFDSGITGFGKSHKRYLNVFGRGFENDTDYYRENTFKILRTWDGISLEGNFLAINETPTWATGTNTPLWKLPSIDFAGTIPLEDYYNVLTDTGLTFEWDADYVNYWREDGVGGHRVDLKPSLSMPIPISDYLETRAEASLRETFYSVVTYGDAVWANDDTQNRLLPEFEVETATTFERDFFLGESANRNFNHQFRPYIKYGYIPEEDQDELPYFDGVDFIGEKNQITYGLDNFFDTFRRRDYTEEELKQREGLLSSDDDQKEIRKDYGQIKIEQSYDLRSEESDEPFSDIWARFNWRPINKTEFIYKTYYDVYDSEFNEHTFEGIYENSRGDHIALEYSFKENIDEDDLVETVDETTGEIIPIVDDDIEQINANARLHLLWGWSLEGAIEHSLITEETVNARGSIIYEALCWSVKFETKYTPADTTYYLLFNLANIGVPLGIDY